MAFVLGFQTYGKAEVRLVKVIRDQGRHDLADLTVTVTLEGDFDAAYVDGDARAILPTGAITRTVYALAKDDPLSSLEEFGGRLVTHFLDAAPLVRQAEVRLVSHPWDRIAQHPNAFLRAGGGDRNATVMGTRQGTQVRAGISDLLVVKTAGAGFAGFLKEDHTLFEESSDRILATVLIADWSYADWYLDFTEHWEGVRQTVLEAFAGHESQSVQRTIWILGHAVLDRFSRIEHITFSLPNRHHLLVDLEPLGSSHEGDVFSVPDRPYGLITGTVRRS